MGKLDSMKASKRFNSIVSKMKTKEIRESINKSNKREPKTPPMEKVHYYL